MYELTAAARLAAWGGAALAGAVSLDEAADAVTGPDDAGHRVFSLVGDRGGVNLAYALGRLRADGATGLRLVLPRPGDVAGLPGPPGFNEKAVARGEAILTVGGPPRGVLGEGRGAWTVHEVAADPRTPLGLRDAERDLQRVMREATELLLSLDVARWEPAAAEVLQHRAERALCPRLPRSHPPQAQLVLESASRLLLIVDLARRSDGAALSAAESAARAGVLRELDAAARRGLEAACSTPG
ncbi:MAG: hypothetical protein ACXV4A_00355 [Actinomycetes bacterium]